MTKRLDLSRHDRPAASPLGWAAPGFSAMMHSKNTTARRLSSGQRDEAGDASSQAESLTPPALAPRRKQAGMFIGGGTGAAAAAATATVVQILEDF